MKSAEEVRAIRDEYRKRLKNAERRWDECEADDPNSGQTQYWRWYVYQHSAMVIMLNMILED